MVTFLFATLFQRRLIKVHLKRRVIYLLLTPSKAEKERFVSMGCLPSEALSPYRGFSGQGLLCKNYLSRRPLPALSFVPCRAEPPCIHSSIYDRKFYRILKISIEKSDFL